MCLPLKLKRPKARPRILGECPICGNIAMLGEEHILPWWLECLVHDLGPFGDRVGEGEVQSWNEHLGIKTYLCSPCNRRFGKKFEEPASRILKPMIRPCP